MNAIKVKVIGTEGEQVFYLDDPEQRNAYNKLISKEGMSNLLIGKMDETNRVQYLCTYLHIENTDEYAIFHCIVWARNKIDAAKSAADYFDLKSDNYYNIEVDELVDIPVEKVDYSDISCE